MQTEQNSEPLEKQKRLQSLFFDKEYRGLPVIVSDQMILELTPSEFVCWYKIYSDAFFTEDWSICKSRNELADDIFKKSKQTINTWIAGLEEKGYLQVIKQNGSKGWEASRIRATLPDHLIELLESSKDRNKASKIKKCGTMAVSSANAQPRQENLSKVGKKTCQPLYNNIIKNNNNTEDLASGEKRTIQVPQAQSSVVVSNFIVDKPIANNNPRKAIEACSKDKSSAIDNSSKQDINLFVDDSVGSCEALEQKASEMERLKKCIDVWQQELDSIKQQATSYDLIRRSGKLEMWIKQHQDKLEHLNKPLKRESLQLSNGKRSLTENDCKKLHSVLIEAVDSGKITKTEANKTIKSMVRSILQGYYFQENVEVAKSVNSVIKKFKTGEWNNSDPNEKDRTCRPQPKFWNAAKHKNNKINFSGIIKSVN